MSLPSQCRLDKLQLQQALLLNLLLMRLHLIYIPCTMLNNHRYHQQSGKR